MKNSIKEYQKNLINTIENIEIESIQQIALTFIEARDKGKTIYTIGNGGSGSTASHMVCDITKGCSFNKKKRFKMFCLNDNIPTILAYSNDVSYDVVFEEQLKNVINQDDVVLAISGSGNSKNIIRAVKYAKSVNAKTIGMTGYDGGQLKRISDISLNANINDMQISEDVHVIVMHMLYKLLENE
jgi:D-sedoheptulose 7-phosphate isomerase